MLGLILRWLLCALALLLVARFVPGIHASIGAALAAAVVIGLLNMIVKPLLVILTLPLTLLTFGLFIFVINALLFWLAAALVPGFTVHGFRAAFVGALLYAVFAAIIQMVLRRMELSRVRV